MQVEKVAMSLKGTWLWICNVIILLQVNKLRNFLGGGVGRCCGISNRIVFKRNFEFRKFKRWPKFQWFHFRVSMGKILFPSTFLQLQIINWKSTSRLSLV